MHFLRNGLEDQSLYFRSTDDSNGFMENRPRHLLHPRPKKQSALMCGCVSVVMTSNTILRWTERVTCIPKARSEFISQKDIAKGSASVHRGHAHYTIELSMKCGRKCWMPSSSSFICGFSPPSGFTFSFWNFASEECFHDGRARNFHCPQPSQQMHLCIFCLKLVFVVLHNECQIIYFHCAFGLLFVSFSDFFEPVPFQ